jgi:hypothetical protein
VQPQAVPRGTESPSATIDQPRDGAGLLATDELPTGPEGLPVGPAGLVGLVALVALLVGLTDDAGAERVVLVEHPADVAPTRARTTAARATRWRSTDGV